MKFPYPVYWRKQRFATIYAPSENYGFYRLCYRAGGRRIMRSFERFSEAKAKEIWGGDDNAALTPNEAKATLEISRALATYRQETGRNIVATDAVKEYLAALRLLPEDVGLVEAVRAWRDTVATLRPIGLAEAVQQFTKEREALTVPHRAGERPELHRTYHADVTRVLNRFSAMLPGHHVADLTSDHLTCWARTLRDKAPKSANNARAAVSLFLRWCADEDRSYLPRSSALLRSNLLKPSKAGKVVRKDFYRPEELAQLLQHADEEIRPLIALQALAGVHPEESLRLRWKDVFGRIGHVEVGAEIAKTRQQRVIPIEPSLDRWLAPYRGQNHDAPIWSGATVSGYVQRLRKLRKLAGVPDRRNGLRKGFVSHGYALWGAKETAIRAGHDESMLFNNYRGLVDADQARAWFNVAPVREENVIPLRKEAARA